MSQIPETGTIVNISVSNTIFHPRQTRKGAQWSKYRNCPLRMTHYVEGRNDGEVTIGEEKFGCLWIQLQSVSVLREKFTFTFTLTFRALSRCFNPKRLTISRFVIRKEKIHCCRCRCSGGARKRFRWHNEDLLSLGNLLFSRCACLHMCLIPFLLCDIRFLSAVRNRSVTSRV